MDVFAKDLIIVLIHCYGNHWALALINLLERRFEFLDSVGGASRWVL